MERPANYFGKGTAADDDKALQALGRAALLQGHKGSSFRVSQVGASERFEPWNAVRRSSSWPPRSTIDTWALTSQRATGRL